MTTEAPERTAANVVTSENLADFMTERLDLAKPEPVVALDAKTEQPAAIEPPDEVPPQEGDTAEEHAEKVKNSYQKLREQRNTAREEANALKAANEATARELADLKARAPVQIEPVPEANPKPDPTKYTDQAKFDEDMLNWRIDEGIRKRDAELVQRQRTATVEKQKADWKARVDFVAAEIPDFMERIKANDVPVHPLIEQAIYQSDVGPQMLLYITDHKAEIEAMNRMPLNKMMREFARIEGLVEAPAGKPANLEAPKAPKVDPIEPIKGGAVASDPIGSDGEFKGTFAEYRAARLAGKIK